MSETKQYYKTFPLFGQLSAKEDMSTKQQVWVINDLMRKGLTTRLAVTHIIRADSDNDQAYLYGINVNLSFAERLIEKTDGLYYKDALGDEYIIENDAVNGLQYTAETPAWIKKLPLYQEKIAPVGSIRWLTSGNVVKGFNSDGYLVFISDEKRKFYYLYRVTASNLLSLISDYSTATVQHVYSFEYNDVEEYGNYHLKKIRDYVTGDYVEFEYNSEYEYARLVKITRSVGQKYDITYDDKGHVESITSSEGYKAECQQKTDGVELSVRSLYESIPDSTATTQTTPEMRKWIIAYSDNECVITDINGDKEHYKFQNEDNHIYVKESGGVVTEAYETINVPHQQKGAFYADRGCLYVPYDEFKFNSLEMDTIYFNENDLIRERRIDGHKIAFGSGKYSTADIIEKYFYNEEKQCYRKQTDITLNLYTGAKKEYTQVTVYEYDKDTGMLIEERNYMTKGNGPTEVKAIVNTYGYKFSEDGSYQTRRSHFRSDVPALGYRAEENYDSYGRKVSEKDPSGSYTISYSHAMNNKSYTVRRTGYPLTYYGYDNSDRFERVYYTETDVDEGTVYISNYVNYINGELIRMFGSDKIEYGYDEKRRPSKITIDGNTGSKNIEYEETDYLVTATVTNENGERVKTETSKDGTKQTAYYSPDGSTAYDKELYVESEPDGSLTTVSDYVNSTTVQYRCDKLGQLTQYTEKRGAATKVKEDYEYDEYGSLKQQSLTGAMTATYAYEYDDTLDHRLTGMNFYGITEDYEYDSLNRIKSKKVSVSGGMTYEKIYEYRDVYDTSLKRTNATNQPASIKYKFGNTIKQQIDYSYNSMTGHLNEITVNGKRIEYLHSNERLRREDNQLLGESAEIFYSYEGKEGTKMKGQYQPENSGTVDGSSIHYEYDGDRLMSYNGKSCVYDGMGNPTTYLGKSVTWKGRQMMSFNGNTFKYNGRGRRTNKNSIAFTYDSRGNLIKQSNGLEFYYDIDGIAACKYNGTMYYYMTDAQGNVIGIVDRNGNVVVQYWYDAWGNHKVVSSNGTVITSSAHIGNVNPFRYRGYYYDTETGLYFLQTRYYDPEVGRFLNRDSVQYADPQTFGGLDLYAYCLNNPVEYVDPDGTFILSVFLICLSVGAIAGGVAGGVTAAQNGSDILQGIFTGVLLGGAVGAIAGLGGAYLMGGMSSIASKLISDAVASIASGTNCFGSWEDYSIAFIFGGLIKGANLGNGLNKFLDVAIRPLANQAVKMGTRNAEFNPSKYFYDVASRLITYGNSRKNTNILYNLNMPLINVDLTKSISRGLFSAAYKLLDQLL